MSSVPDFQFSPSDRRAMLALAREAVLGALQGRPLERVATESRCFSLCHGVFVTLEVAGRLRGCIGVVEAREPLREAIIHCAQGAAFRDPRFSPLRPEEISGLQIEISVLSNVSPIRPDEIEIGKHGLVIASAGNRGLLLPQVAAEQHLSREQFLEETCRKAALPRDAWRQPETSVSAFTCEVFHEDPDSAPA
jgi:AmmeMemoRadiSam system protein A